MGACGRGGYAGIGTGGPVRRGRGRVRSGQVSHRVRSGQVRSGQGAAMGRVPGADAGRGRGVVHGPECGPVADVGRGALRIPGGAAARSLAGAARPSKWVFGSSYTRRQSTRSLVGNRCGSLPTPSRAIHPARQMHHAACIMQHDACSVQHAPCNGKQQKCNFLHARDDSMLASMHCAVLRLSVQPSQRQSQSHAKDAPTNAPWQIQTCPSKPSA